VKPTKENAASGCNYVAQETMAYIEDKEQDKTSHTAQFFDEAGLSSR
jgi:hypothetical protein